MSTNVLKAAEANTRVGIHPNHGHNLSNLKGCAG